MWLFATNHRTNPFIRCDGSEERKHWHQPPAWPWSSENTDTEMTRKLRLSACQFKQINNSTKHRTAPSRSAVPSPVPSLSHHSSLDWSIQRLCSCSRVTKIFSSERGWSPDVRQSLYEKTNNKYIGMNISSMHAAGCSHAASEGPNIPGFDKLTNCLILSCFIPFMYQ